jgi:tetratricopeptide (TPR) repeat protein
MLDLCTSLICKDARRSASNATYRVSSACCAAVASILITVPAFLCSSCDTKFVGTVEQMVASRCFRESSGPDKLGCISCHDPHKRPTAQKKTAYYRARCLNCHTERSCNLPRALRLEKSKEDSCLVCHMPGTGSDVNHTSITDHRILRRPEITAKERPADGWPRAGQIPLVRFHNDFVGMDEKERGRDLGVALMDLTEKQAVDVARQLSDMALPLLNSALTTAAADAPAWEAKGSALWFQGRPQESLTAFETALKHAPQRETSLFLAATLALRMKQRDTARTHAERAIRVNPWRWQNHQILAAVHAQDEDWRAAIHECQEALKLDAANLAARKLLITGYLRIKDTVQARGGDTAAHRVRVK